MAGDWIKLQTCTPDKPEVYLIAEELNLDPDAVVGKLVRIWCWADAQTRDGYASVTKALLDRVTGVTGFTTAMLHVGWLVETEAGLMFPNFDRHNGKTAKTRAMGTVRVQNHRSKSDCNAPRNDSVTQVKREKDDSGVTKPLPEKRREEKTLTVSSLQTQETQDTTTEPPFPLLSCNRSEWAVIGECAVPPSLGVFQNEVLAWVRHLRAIRGPNFDPNELETHFRDAVRLGRKFPGSCEWSLKTRMERLANPKHDPDDKIDFAMWHSLRLAFDGGGKNPVAIKECIGDTAFDAWVKLARTTLKGKFDDDESRAAFASEFLGGIGIDMPSRYFQILKEACCE